MNTVDKLVQMANQIARNLEAIHDPDPARATASHIAHFWDPRMRSLIFDRLASGGEGLEPVALRAVAALRDEQAPQPNTAGAGSPNER